MPYIRDSGSLFNGNNSVWSGRGGSWAEGWLVWVDQCCTPLMEGALHRMTLRPWQNGPSAGWHQASHAGVHELKVQPSVTLPLLIILTTIASSILGSQSSSVQGLCPHQGSDLEQWLARFGSEPNKSLFCGVLQGLPLRLTDFHLMTYPFCWLCLQSLRNSLCLLSKQACRYFFFFFHRKTWAEAACANKPVGAPLADGSQQ